MARYLGIAFAILGTGALLGAAAYRGYWGVRGITAIFRRNEQDLEHANDRSSDWRHWVLLGLAGVFLLLAVCLLVPK